MDKIVEGKESKLPFLLYNFLHILTQINNYDFKCVECIQNILQECGLSYIWLTRNVENVKQSFIDQVQQKWVSDCNASSKRLVYNVLPITPLYLEIT